MGHTSPHTTPPSVQPQTISHFEGSAVPYLMGHLGSHLDAYVPYLE